VLVLDHYLEVLKVKPGALPGATALAQAMAGGVFTATYQACWDAVRRAYGDAAGTRALIEVLLAHRGPGHGDGRRGSHRHDTPAGGRHRSPARRRPPRRRAASPLVAIGALARYRPPGADPERLRGPPGQQRTDRGAGMTRG